ncbi:MAG: hypothetical protein ACK5E4_14690 [Planctomycetia bacterium]
MIHYSGAYAPRSINHASPVKKKIFGRTPIALFRREEGGVMGKCILVFHAQAPGRSRTPLHKPRSPVKAEKSPYIPSSKKAMAMDIWLGHVGDKSTSKVYYTMTDAESQQFMARLSLNFESILLQKEV